MLKLSKTCVHTQARLISCRVYAGHSISILCVLQVLLGSGLMIKETKLQYITASRQEMRVARDLARHYWTTAHMEIRSISGALCQNQGGRVLKPLKATPEKVDTIMSKRCTPATRELGMTFESNGL